MNLSLPEFIFSSAGLWRLFICAAFFLRPIFPAFDALRRLAFCYLRKFAPAGGAKAIFAFIFLRADSLGLRTKSAENKKSAPLSGGSPFVNSLFPARGRFQPATASCPQPPNLSAPQKRRQKLSASRLRASAPARAPLCGTRIRTRIRNARHTAGYESLTCSQAPSFALLLSAASIKARPILPSSTVA